MAVFEFGSFSLNVAERSLVRRGRPLRLSQRLFDILTLLIENSDRVVTKAELIESIWSETIVEESNLTVAISRIRTLLGDDTHRPKYIVTLPRSGYRFIGEVRRIIKAEGNSVAVLPFAHDYTYPESEDLAASLTDSLIYGLSTLTNLKVTPRSSVNRYTGKQVDPAKVASTLGVSSLVTGRIVHQSEKLTFSVELLGAGCRELLWGKQYHGHASDLLATQRDIVRAITEELNIEPSGEISEPALHRGSSNDAYNLYLRGRFHWNKRSEMHVRKSIDYFKQAIKKDPTYGLAYTGLADSYNMLGFYSMIAPNQAFPRAKAAALKALAIDDSIAEAHASFGFATFWGEWDSRAAEKAFTQSIQHDPNCLAARLYYGCLLVAGGRFDEAIQQYQRGLEIEPLSLIANAALGYGYYYARRHDDAITQCKAAIELDEHFGTAHLFLGWVYEQTGCFNEAIAEYERVMSLSGEQTSVLAHIGAALALAGRKVEAERTLHDLVNQSRQRFVSPYHVACIYAALEDKEKAFEYLEAAYRLRSHLLVNLQVDPKLDSLRSDLRLAELAVRIAPATYYTQNGKTLQCYREGRHFWSTHTQEGLQRAVEYFRRHIELDSPYIPTYAAIIDCYLRLSTSYFLPANVGWAAARENVIGEQDASITLRSEWDAATAAREIKRATDLNSPIPDKRLWHWASIFSQRLYENTLSKSQVEFAGAAKGPDNLSDAELPDHLGRISLAEQVQIACVVTRDQVEVGNIDAGYLMLQQWYSLGQWPRLNGLSPQLSADLLLTAGVLAGRYASSRLIPRGQKHAEALLNGAISLFEQLNLKPRVAEARSELGRCYDREGMFDLAQAQFLTALEELPPGYPELVGRTLLRLAFAEMKVGRLRDALKRLDDASEIVATAGSSTADFYHVEMATTLGELAISEHSHEFLDQACVYYRKALSNSEAVGHHRRTAVLENNHGHLMVAFTKLKDAEASLTRARNLFRHFSDPCPQLEETLARFYLETGRFDLAEKTIFQSVSKLERVGEEAMLAESLRTQGRILCRLGRHREGRRVLDRAYQIAERCDDNEGAGLAALTTIEEMSDHLEPQEQVEILAAVGRLLGECERTSLLQRLRTVKAQVQTNGDFK